MISIRTKVLAIIALWLLVSGALTAIGVWGVNRTADATDKLYTHPYVVTNALANLHSEMLGSHTRMLSLMTQPRLRNVDNTARAVAESWATIQANLAVLRARYLGPKADVNEVAAALTAWHAPMEASLQRHRDGAFVASHAIYDAAGQVSFGRAIDAVTRMLEFARGKADTFLAQSQRERDGLVLRMLAITAASLVFSAIVALLVSASITRPLGRLVKQTRAIADGDYSGDVSGTARRDEVGAMARALEGFRGAAVQRLRLEAKRRQAEQRAAELSDLSDQYRRDKQRAEQSNAAKTRFLANMSHEFKTPLNAIIGFSDILGRQMFGPLGSDRYASYADSIAASARHLKALIDDALDMARLEAGRWHLRRDNVDLADVLRDSVALVKLEAERRATTVDVLPEGLPGRVWADPQILRQILINLLSNAVKYTQPGGRVSAAAWRVGDRLHLLVEDNGPGIPEVELPRVVEPFEQAADGGFVSGSGGTGLGLAITKALAEVHGGEMQIDSAPGRGTKVFVTLDVAAAIMPEPVQAAG